MNSFKRVKRAINFESPDRVPVMHAVLPGAWYKHGDDLYNIIRKFPSDLVDGGKPSFSTRAAACGYNVNRDIARKYTYDDDFGYIEPRHFMYGPSEGTGRRKDEWGCIWVKADPGIAGQVVGNPLRNWEDYKSYQFPNPLDHWRWDEEELSLQVTEAKNLNKYVIGYGGNLFEKMQWLRGYEELMVDIAANRSRISELADKITEYIILTIDKLSEFKIDGIMLTDDWGTQNALMISPDIWRSVFKPYYKVIFERISRHGIDVHFHTDGSTIEIIPDLIEIGCDVLNPQFSAINLESLGKIAKNRICIRTDIDRQYMLTRAIPDEMDAYIKSVFNVIGSEKGGIIACGELNSDCSLDLVNAMYEAFEKYGRYF